MSVVTTEQMVERLVDAEIREARIKRPFAQRIVAARAGLAPTAIETLQRGRTKHHDRISSPIRRLYISFLERQISRLETDLAHARAHDPDRDFCSVEAAIARARAALDGNSLN